MKKEGQQKMYLSPLKGDHAKPTPTNTEPGSRSELAIIFKQLVEREHKRQRLIREINARDYKAPESALLRALNPRLSFDDPPSNHHYAVYKDYVAFFNWVKSDPAAKALPYNAWADFTDSLSDNERPFRLKRTKATPQYSRCKQCGTPFTILVNEVEKLTLSQFAFCNETLLTSGECKRAWLAAHPVLKQPSPRFNQITPEDVDWAERQASLRDLSAERVPTNFCPATRSYVLQDHTCYEALGNQIFAHRCEERVTQNHESVATVKHERWLNTIERLRAAQKLLKQWNDRREQDRQSRVSFYKTFCPVAKPPIQSLTAALQRAAHKFTSPTLRTGALLDIWSDSVAEHIDAVGPKTSFYHYPTGAPFDLVTSGYDDSIPRKTNDSLPSEWEGFKKGRELMLGNVNQLDRSITKHLSHKECNPLVNTSGSEATNGAQIDRSSRDRRGDAVGRYKEAQLEPSVWTRCVYCNRPFEANEGARTCTDNCRKHRNEEFTAKVAEAVSDPMITEEVLQLLLKESDQCLTELEEELMRSK